MGKLYTVLGLMSGTSGDGIDASVLQTDGETQYKELENKFFKYSRQISSEIHRSKTELLNQVDAINFSKDTKLRKKFVQQSGNQSISVSQLKNILKQKSLTKSEALIILKISQSNEIKLHLLFFCLYLYA